MKKNTHKEIGDAYRFTDGNCDQWLGVVNVCQSNGEIMVKDVNNIFHDISIINKKGTRMSFEMPEYLGNIYIDKKLAKKLKIKFVKEYTR